MPFWLMLHDDGRRALNQKLNRQTMLMIHKLLNRFFHRSFVLSCFWWQMNDTRARALVFIALYTRCWNVDVWKLYVPKDKFIAWFIICNSECTNICKQHGDGDDNKEMRNKRKKGAATDMCLEFIIYFYLNAHIIMQFIVSYFFLFGFSSKIENTKCGSNDSAVAHCDKCVRLQVTRW